MINFLRKKILHRLFPHDIQRMIAAEKIPDQFVSLNRIKTLGFQPKTVFDVGAYQGDFTDMCLKLWPGSQVRAFEALPEKFQKLTSRFTGSNVKVVNALVGENNRADVEFFADETASSVLESQEFTPKKRLHLEMITLDTYVIREQISAPDFLKIDTQGYEYPILKGFEQHLPNVKLLLLELNFIEVYSEVALAHHVIQYLAQRGFVIYDICEIHRRPLDKALFQIDFLFVKEDSDLRKDKRWDVVR